MTKESSVVVHPENKNVLGKVFVSTLSKRPNFSFKLFKNSSERKNKQIKIEGESNKICLTSSNYGQSNTVSNFSNHFLIVIKQNEDGTKDKSVSILRPEILGKNIKVKSLNNDGISNASNSVATAASANLDYKTSQTLLGETFGTKKRKQAINSLEKNQINVDKILSSSSKYISKSIDLKASRSNTPPSTPSSLLIDNGILPPYSPTATEFDLVFPEIIPSEIRSQLKSLENLENLLISNDFQKQFFDEIYNNCRGNDEKLLRLQFLCFLMKFSLFNEGQINNCDYLISNLPGSTALFCESLVTFFTEKIYDAAGKFRFKFNNIKKDRLLSYIALLNISLDPNHKCNVNPLSKILKLPITKMLQCFKACGCKLIPSPGSSKTYQDGKIMPVKIVSFTAPIVLPKSTRRN
jgi:hypothetical protein